MSEKLKRDSYNKSVQVSQVAAKTAIYSGPIPPPEVLERYERIISGAAERIIKMAEKEQNHRHDIENKIISSEIKNTKLGLTFGFIIGITGIVAGAIATILGHNVGGSIISGISIVSLVALFINRTKNK